MIFRLVFVSCIVVSASSFCSTQFPNNTDTSLHWWQCGGSLAFNSVVSVNKNKTPTYPVHLSEPFTLLADVYNPLEEFNSPDLKLTVNIFNWDTGFDCGWATLPTFGLLTNVNACTHGVSCPILNGQQTVTISIDFSQYQSIYNLLDDGDTEMFVYKIAAPGKASFGCLTIQARMFLQ